MARGHADWDGNTSSHSANSSCLLTEAPTSPDETCYKQTLLPAWTAVQACNYIVLYPIICLYASLRFESGMFEDGKDVCLCRRRSEPDFTCQSLLVPGSVPTLCGACPFPLYCLQTFGQTPCTQRGSEEDSPHYLAFLSSAASRGPSRNARPAEGQNRNTEQMQEPEATAASEHIPFQRRSNTRSRTAPAYTLDNLAVGTECRCCWSV